VAALVELDDGGLLGVRAGEAVDDLVRAHVRVALPGLVDLDTGPGAVLRARIGEGPDQHRRLGGDGLGSGIGRRLRGGCGLGRRLRGGGGLDRRLSRGGLGRDGEELDAPERAPGGGGRLRLR
jgi:hypothetical protein